MKAIRRFTVRPVLPEPLRPLSDLARNLRWSWHTETRELFQAVDPDGWRAAGGTPCGCSAPSAPPGSTRARPGPPLPAQTHRRRRRPRRLSARPPLVPGAGQRRTARRHRATSRPSSASPPPCRSTPAASASSPATISSPPATSAYRSSGSACSTGTATSASPSRATAGSRSTTRCSTPTSCRSPCCARRTAPRPGSRSRCPAAAPLHASDLAGPGRPGAAAACSTRTSRRTGRGERDVTDRLYGGGSEHRLLQEMLLGIGGVRAVRTYCRLTGHPAPEVFHTNEGHAGFLGLERIRELRGRGARIRRRARSGAGRDGLHHPHPGARRHRPLRPRAGRPPLRRRRRAARAWTSRGSSGSAWRPTPAASPNLFNMAVMGLRLAQRANGVSTLHGAVSREMFAGCGPASTRRRCRSPPSPTACTRPTWVAPEVFRLGARQIGAGRTEDALTVGGADRWDAVAGIPDARDLGAAQGAARAARHRGAGAAARLLAPARRGIGRTRLDRRGVEPRRAHHRLRPAGPLVQAAHADAARPGPADGAAAASRRGRCRSSSRARRTPPTTAASGSCRSW